MEYLYYQTLIGAWPIDIDRMRSYLIKAAREAKQHTSWTAPSDEYETALKKFVEGTMGDPEFCATVETLVNELKPIGFVNSLSQTLLKLTVSGVPDIYQGSELWDLRLVDPDNRTKVDFELRRGLLAQLKEMKVDDVVTRWEEGRPKLWTIYRTLMLRQSRPEIFGSGSYDPIVASGDKAAHVFAFIRSGTAVTIVSRLLLSLAGNWGDTSLELPAGKWQNVLTGENIAGGRNVLSKLLQRFPVALLVRDKKSGE